MVAVSPNLTLTLEALGSHGAVLSTEVKAALVHSIPLKEAELNVNGLALWGRISTLNGRDYLIACANESLRAVEDKASSNDKRIAANMQTLLSGDPQAKHYWPPQPDQEEEEPSGDDEGRESKPAREEVTELRRLRVMVDEITSQTDLVPAGCQIINADGCIVPNPLFAGVEYPDKLEAFYHQHLGPTGTSAAQDVRGSWTLVYDKFRNITVCRNLLYMGYTFYYNSTNKTWGGFYHGDGLKNNDLIFML